MFALDPPWGTPNVAVITVEVFTYSTVPRAVTWLTVYRALQVSFSWDQFYGVLYVLKCRLAPEIIQIYGIFMEKDWRKDNFRRSFDC